MLTERRQVDHFPEQFRSIVILFDPKESGFLGTAFFYEPNKLITCKHVLASSKGEPCVMSRTSLSLLELKDVCLHEYADLATAKLGDGCEEVFPTLQLDLQPERRVGTDVTNYGYIPEAASDERTAFTPRLQKGHIMRVFKDIGDRASSYLEISFPAVCGLSGSPIISEDSGKVLGVLSYNKRSQMLEDTYEETSVKEGTESRSETYKAYRVIEYGVAVDLCAHPEFF